ncbi:MAG: hypothetical protein ACP5UN_01400 [Candidatus Micrarchaeia archaeon]
MSTVAAKVNVACPFKNIINSKSYIYIIPQSINLSYSAVALENCSTNLIGNIIIENTTNIVYQKAIKFNNVNLTKQSNILTINSDNFNVALYSAIIETNSSAASNSSRTSFIVFAPANIIIKDVEVSPAIIGRYSNLVLIETIVNNGPLASSNMLATIKITGPSGFSETIMQPIQSLASGSSEALSLVMHGLTNFKGNYNLTENISYYSNYYYNNTNYFYGPYISNNANTTYSVYIPYYQSTSSISGLPPSQQYPPPTPTIPKVSGTSLLNFLIYPFMINLPSGSSVLKQIGLNNPTNNNITVNIRAAQIQNISIGFSSNVVIIPPHKSIYINTLFSSEANTMQELINIPLNFTINSNNKTYYSNAYTTLSIAPQNNKINFISTGDLVNSSNFYISIDLNNPTNKTIKNITISYPLPTAALSKNTSITLSGGTHLINISNNSYVLSWYVPALQPNSKSLISGEILNISNAQYLDLVQPSFYTISQNKSMVNLLGVYAPTIYVNSSAKAIVTLLYTGAFKNNITLTLTGPLGINISHPATISVYPNEVIKKEFYISPIETAGIRNFILHISGAGISQNYTIPLIIMNYPTPTTETTEELINMLAFPIAFIIIFSAIILGVAHYSIKKAKEARYNAKRLNELKNIKNLIENSSEKTKKK